MEKKKIIIDSDGFFWPNNISDDYASAERRGISIEQENQPVSSLIEQYYLGFRSAMLICEDQIKSEEDLVAAKEALRNYREGCLVSALQYVKSHLAGKLTLPIDFLWITRMAIIDELKGDYPEVEDIQLRLSMKPRISARTIDKNIIIFPALARVVVNHCNLVMINTAFYCLDRAGKQAVDIDRRQISRFVLPYLLFCHDDFSVKNLPIIGAYSEEAAFNAFWFTNLQIMFVFAHEYAHILLGHFKHDVLDYTSNMDIESEADNLALSVVLRYVRKYYDHYGPNAEIEVFTAVRWLFKFQLIEETIGALIRGEEIDYLASSYEKRRSEFQTKLFSQYDFSGSSLIDAIGFSAIVKLQNVLYESGLDLIDDIINAFEKSDKTGEIEPWWEKIAKN